MVVLKSISNQYLPHRLHPVLFGPEFKEEWLHKDFLEIQKAFQKAPPETAIKPEEISDKLKVEIPEVYSFNTFTPEFLKLFNEEIKNFYKASKEHNIPTRQPNGMNKYGVVVNEIGMRPLLTTFQQDYLWPIASRLYPKQGSQFDDHHSFIVRYQAEEDLGLDMHTDDSDVTFNVCMGEEFTGAHLTFCGMFGAPDHRKQSHVYHHEVGRAIIHLGSRRHGADDIDTGKRCNLIVWNHNWAWRSSNEYKAMRTAKGYKKEEGPPDETCLSYTHDIDYAAYKEIPEHVDLDTTHTTPWCPPMGTEYDEFDEVMNDAAKKRKLDHLMLGHHHHHHHHHHHDHDDD